MAGALLPVAEAQALMLAGVEPLDAETVALSEAAGRTLAAPLAALRTQPPVPLSRMDGYALRAGDAVAGARLRLVGTAAAGHAFAGTLNPGETARIFTGAPLPSGADAVLIQENASAEDGFVIVGTAVAMGEHVRPRGLDFAAGTTPLAPGRVLDARALSLAAAMGHGSVSVRRRPRVAILATGDELVSPGAPASDNQTVASSGVGLAALVAEAGGLPEDLGIVPDDLALLRKRLRLAFSSADVVVVLGGASVGDRDLTRPAFEAEGVTPGFWRIAMRPGKPLVYGRRGRVRLLGLPGNPVSTLVCGLLFLAPLIRALLGQSQPLPRTEPARLAVDLSANDSREDYVRATLQQGDDLPVVTPLPVQDSSMLLPLAAAAALLIRPAHAPAVPAGAACRILRL